MHFVFYLTLCPHPSGSRLIRSLLWSTRSSEPSSRILHSSTCNPAQLKSTETCYIRKITNTYHLYQDYWGSASCCVFFLTLSAFIDDKFVFDKFSEDLVAAAVFEAGDGGQETHWNDLMVLHAHLNLSGEVHRKKNP